MLYIAHRINTIEELKTIPITFGVEIDLRDKDGTLILQHDPFKDCENFTDWCQEYKMINIGILKLPLTFPKRFNLASQ